MLLFKVWVEAENAERWPFVQINVLNSESNRNAVAGLACPKNKKKKMKT